MGVRVQIYSWEKVIMKVFKVNEKAEIPEFATEGSSCFDLRACLTDGTTVKAYNPHNKKLGLPVRINSGSEIYVQIPPQFRVLIPSGLIFSIPNHHEVKIYPRSGIALKNGLTLANGTGVVDSDYVEETYMMLYNMSDTPMIVKDGDRVAQARMEKVLKYDLEESNLRPAKRTNRAGGMGSTGVE